VEAVMAGLRPELPGARVQVLGGINRPPMHESASADLFPLAEKAAARIGLVGLRGVAVGGGSDGNFTAAIGVPTLDGLGPVGGGAHARDEHVVAAEMPRRAEMVARLVQSLLRDG
ncbi:MAG: M20/M25/M40 family metallo-hydrolase, partial [Actinomycetota bacterium]|nr:M20/M25/M40 family metallo-hydrolase [Actinomycetota bacterium]